MRNTKGFTLIELLIVVVIIGILAAIALPQFASTKEKSFDASAKSDLRNLMTAQEAYFSDYQHYETVTIDDGTPWLDANGNALLVASQQVSLGATSNATPAYFTATASHAGSSRGWCVTTNPTDQNAGKIQLQGAGTC
jgi:prepilin-type N-terminal cleavage/methylation domain-containing protein